MRPLFLLFLLLFSGFSLSAYEVEIIGIESPTLRTAIEKNSFLLELQDRPLKKKSALKRRAEEDVERFLKLLTARGYFGAETSFEIDNSQPSPKITVTVHEGPLYVLEKFEIVPSDPEKPFPFPALEAIDLELCLKSPALPKMLIDAEDRLLEYLAEEGYPLAKIVKKETLANKKKATITYRLNVDAGPLCRFGPVSFHGNERTSSDYMARKIVWEAGATFEWSKIEKTRRNFEDSALFDSVSVRFSDLLPESQELPIEIEVSESKMRSLGLGASYTTIHGAGVLFEWQHRNVRGEGERIDVKSRILQNLQEGIFSYTKPDFLQKKQNLVFLGELEREETKSFDESYISFSILLQRRINRFFNASAGIAIKELKSTSFQGKDWFLLLKFPIQLRWSRLNNVLDPTDGFAITVLSAPSLQMKGDPFFYSINTMTTALYCPLEPQHRLSFAVKNSIGSIFGASRKAIPISERYFLGSDTALRGYRYMTVSPLVDGDHPIGGRSLLLFSLELRAKWNENWGGIFFYDLGNTFSYTLFPMDQKLLQSVGLGLRYFTPVGPLRFDLAFPLNPRQHLDRSFELYMSIGQAF